MDIPVNKTERARSLRKKNTKSESLLWGLLRAKQLCGLKFRREHPIGPHFADFACVSKMLVVEIDGGYHDHVAENDLEREEYLRKRDWKVIRFSDKEVEDDIEAVGIHIAKTLGVKYEYTKRTRSKSGIEKI
jgi:very-short-patch-repair endonuclease